MDLNKKIYDTLSIVKDSRDLRINHDLNLDKFFIKCVDNCIEFFPNPIISDHKINREIYFRPSNCPLISAQDSNQGSCFLGLEIPTASFQFSLVDNKVQVTVLKKDLSLNNFIQALHTNIQYSIINLYQRYPLVNLCFSGGIDSMVLLSYIINLGFLSRTRIVSFENLTQAHHSCLHLNTGHKKNVIDLIDFLKHQCHSTEWLTVTLEDIANAFNHGDLSSIKCYATHAIMSRYRDQVFLMGYHGNQILLHKNIFFDEIVIRQPVWRDTIQKHIRERANFYTTSAQDWILSEDPVGIERQHLLAKPWGALDGMNGNRVFSPIGSDQNFQMLRSLDFSQINPDVILDAAVAKDLIKMNDADALLDLIDNENLKELDNLETIELPMHLIDPAQLYIPQDLLHDREGLEYIHNEISSLDSTSKLSINTAVSIKSLQHISVRYKIPSTTSFARVFSQSHHSGDVGSKTLT